MPTLVAAMGRAWATDPGGVVFGSERTGIAAALWNNRDRQIVDVVADPIPECHIVCLQMAPLEADFFIDGRQRYAGPYPLGNVSFVPPGTVPRAVMRGRFSCMHIYVPATLVTDVLLADLGRRGLDDPVFLDNAGHSSPQMLRLGQELLNEMSTGEELSRSRTDALGLDITVQMLRHHSSVARGNDPPSHRGGLAPWQVRRIKEMISAAPDADLPLSVLAAEVGLSLYHFSRAFQDVDGGTAACLSNGASHRAGPEFTDDDGPDDHRNRASRRLRK